MNAIKTLVIVSIALTGFVYGIQQDGRILTLHQDTIEDRPIWSRMENGSWACGNGDIVSCKGNYIQMPHCYCMYFDVQANVSQLGYCYITCFKHKSTFMITRYATKNATLFNKEMCSTESTTYVTNREGRFCGRCIRHYGLTVYSNLLDCIKCTHHFTNWLRYLAVALLPLTVFYFFVLLFKINFASSRFLGLVFTVQLTLSPLMLRGPIASWLNSDLGSAKRNVLSVTIVTGILGVFNLDFFRDVYSPFCLEPQFTTLHITALEYIPALYPFLLIVVTYALIKLYDRNCFIVVCAWKPFKYFFDKYCKHFNRQTSLVEVFASFILLSSIRMLSTSFFLLMKTQTYDDYGGKQKSYLLYDANVEYFGPEHLPIAILALSVSFLFVIIPFLLLAVYPCRCFQRFLNCIRCNRHTLRVFMDAFQGCYRTAPYDMRYFSAYYFALRLVISFVIVNFSQEVIPGTIGLLLIGCAITIAVFQPYKCSTHNKLDIVTLLLAAFIHSSLSITYVVYGYDKTNNLYGVSVGFCIVGVTTWILYVAVASIWASFRYNYKALFLKLRSKFMKNNVEYETIMDRLSNDELVRYEEHTPLVQRL